MIAYEAQNFGDAVVRPVGRVHVDRAPERIRGVEEDGADHAGDGGRRARAQRPRLVLRRGDQRQERREGVLPGQGEELLLLYPHRPRREGLHVQGLFEVLRRGLCQPGVLRHPAHQGLQEGFQRKQQEDHAHQGPARDRVPGQGQMGLHQDPGRHRRLREEERAEKGEIGILKNRASGSFFVDQRS